MALGMELKLRMGMQLVMTPQLQMAIRLLQMSSMDLQEYLQEELEKNPLLEREDDNNSNSGDTANTEGETPLASEQQTTAENSDYSAASDDQVVESMDGFQVEEAPAVTENQQLESDLPVDAEWTDIYADSASNSFESTTSSSSSSSSSSASSEAPPLENTLVRNDTLSDHLIWQLNLSAKDERERILGMALIDAIDENGYLTSDLESFVDTTGADLDALEDALLLIQSFEPAGVGARNLAECLLLQLKVEKQAVHPYTTLLDHLEDLARRDFRKLGRVLKLTEEELAEAVLVIHSLDPKPGLAYGSEQTSYVVPDVYVRKLHGRWIVEINPDTQPRLRINRHYQDNLSTHASANDKRFMAESARNAQWLIKSLEQRSSTIYRVAESIVRFQEDFLEKGPEHLKPLILKDVADDIGVHESTTSRVTSNKYMHTPRGIFELKYFFSSSLTSQNGESHSSEAVKFKIRKLVESEPPRRPFSDEKLAKMLKEQGIKVARRTVAKYREALNIPSSSRRKQLAPPPK
uniref:RNA polymerase sigma-54 factor n=1 Tax=Magnetococcus massalia (strain MO-1) TaxID=451514 RepID=A0A1S7LMA4_MAGMO|nr:RNA polymerase sigma-54 factor [Candidatus Magnetococcus massalia]